MGAAQALGFALQGLQARAVGSHTGDVPPQSAFERHPMQAPAAPSQKGRAPMQRVVFAVEHSAQEPASGPLV